MKNKVCRLKNFCTKGVWYLKTTQGDSKQWHVDTLNVDIHRIITLIYPHQVVLRVMMFL